MRLGVNIDHIATVRQTRRGNTPDLIEAARICERAGAASIVCHLREDRRHIQDRDVERLRAAVTTHLNLEMSIASDIVRAALRIRPEEVTLVPERRQELTTEGGLDVRKLSRHLKLLITQLHARGIRVSLFIDPVDAQVSTAQAVGARIIELHTGRYADATTAVERRRELDALIQAARCGRTLGLTVAAGHGLDYGNVKAVARIPEIEELNIGFSIISRALTVGLGRAVTEMVRLLEPRRIHARIPA